MFPELELRKKEWMEEMKANMNDNEKQVTKLECTIKYPKNSLLLIWYLFVKYHAHNQAKHIYSDIIKEGRRTTNVC